MGTLRRKSSMNFMVRLMQNYLIYKESVTIEVEKIVSRRAVITVDTEPEWKQFIMIGDRI